MLIMKMGYLVEQLLSSAQSENRGIYCEDDAASYATARDQIDSRSLRLTHYGLFHRNGCRRQNDLLLRILPIRRIPIAVIMTLGSKQCRSLQKR